MMLGGITSYPILAGTPLLPTKHFLLIYGTFQYPTSQRLTTFPRGNLLHKLTHYHYCSLPSGIIAVPPLYLTTCQQLSYLLLLIA